MKKKFSFWFNIVTICLFVCTIAIGIYAATTVNITSSGSVGFEAHGVEMIIDGELSGYVTSAHSTDIQNNIPLTQVKLTKAKTTDSMSLGKNTVYFSDLLGDSITPITLKLTFKNTSKFVVRAHVSVPTEITNNINIVSNKSTTVIDANGGVGEIEYTFTIDDSNISIDNPSTDIEETVDLSTITGLKVDFEKFDSYYEGEFFVEDGKLYVKYGYFPTEDPDGMYGDMAGEPIRWVAIKDTTGATTSLTNLTSVPTGNFYFVSEYLLENCAFNLRFNLPINGKNPNDYAGSAIRERLQSEDFIQKFQLENLVNVVTPRELPTEEITGFLKTNGAYHANYENGYIVNDKANGIAGCTDSLWLLSLEEVVTNSLISSVTGSNKAYYPKDSNNTGNSANWWLRSTNGTFTQYSRFIKENGSGHYGIVSDKHGVRPAFQINIAG